MERDDLVAYLDAYLGTHAGQDYSDNGLQVEGCEEVARLAFAVDACQETIEGAIASGAQMLIVHHGLLWGKPQRIVGPHRRRVRALLAADCSLYAVHLPLDRHPQVGNNAQLARLFELTIAGDLGEAFGMPVGVVAVAPDGYTLEELTSRVAAVLGSAPRVLANGPRTVRRVGIISGAGAEEIRKAAEAGCDTYITGETSHSYYHDSVEYGLNVIYAGHYATETVGLLALADHLESKFGLAWTFVDRPTGL